MRKIERDVAVALMRQYMEGWREGDCAKILDTLAAGCVVIESYGPVYRGKERVRQWITAWFGEGNRVDAWELTSAMVDGEQAAFTWEFACTWHGKPANFEGCSLVRFRDGRIVWLREYATTAPLYEWGGEWRP